MKYKYRDYFFIKNENRNDIYDLIRGPKPTSLNYLILTKPRSDYLIKNGAVYVIECYRPNNEKYFFTGLIRLSGNIFFGDAKNKVKGTHHLIRCDLRDKNTLNLRIYQSDLKTNRERKKYLMRELKKRDHL